MVPAQRVYASRAARAGARRRHRTQGGLPAPPAGRVHPRALWGTRLSGCMPALAGVSDAREPSEAGAAGGDEPLDADGVAAIARGGSGAENVRALVGRFSVLPGLPACRWRTRVVKLEPPSSPYEPQRLPGASVCGRKLGKPLEWILTQGCNDVGSAGRPDARAKRQQEARPPTAWEVPTEVARRGRRSPVPVASSTTRRHCRRGVARTGRCSRPAVCVAGPGVAEIIYVCGSAPYGGTISVCLCLLLRSWRLSACDGDVDHRAACTATRERRSAACCGVLGHSPDAPAGAA